MNSIKDLSAIARYQSPEEYDMTYEDAFLDAQVRQYFDAEYGHVQPPANVLGRVLSQVRIDEARVADTRPPRPIFSPAVLGALYRAFSKPIMSRMVPGGVALMMLVMVGTNYLLLKPDGEVQYNDDQTASHSVAHLGPTTLSQSELELRIGERLDAPSDYPPGPDVLDSVELREPRQMRDARARIEQMRSEKYKIDMYGPQ